MISDESRVTPVSASPDFDWWIDAMCRLLSIFRAEILLFFCDDDTTQAAKQHYSTLSTIMTLYYDPFDDSQEEEYCKLEYEACERQVQAWEKGHGEAAEELSCSMTQRLTPSQLQRLCQALTHRGVRQWSFRHWGLADQGIKILVSSKQPNLQRLSLASCGLTTSRPEARLSRV